MSPKKVKVNDSREITCSQCCRDIPENEVQKCELCGMDGLGNCCIGEGDHECEPDA